MPHELPNNLKFKKKIVKKELSGVSKYVYRGRCSPNPYCIPPQAPQYSPM